jgi:hypothetical protein
MGSPPSRLSSRTRHLVPLIDLLTFSGLSLLSQDILPGVFVVILTLNSFLLAAFSALWG